MYSMYHHGLCPYVCMYVGEVCIYIKEIHNTDQSYVSIKLDMDTIQNLHLNINPAKVKHAIIFGSVRIMYVSMYVCMYKYICFE